MARTVSDHRGYEPGFDVESISHVGNADVAECAAILAQTSIMDQRIQL